MKDNMFYKANPLIFKRAEELRNNQTPAEGLLWNHMRQGQLGINFLRFTNDDVLKNLNIVLEKIKSKIITLNTPL